MCIQEAWLKKRLLDLLLNFLRSSRAIRMFWRQIVIFRDCICQNTRRYVLHRPKRTFIKLYWSFFLFGDDKRKCKRPTIVSHLLTNSILNFFSGDERDEVKSFSLNIKDDKTLWVKLRMGLRITDSFLDHLVSYVPLCLKGIVYPKMKILSLFM